MDCQDVISIIVPIYNSAATLDRCIKSILCQTYPYLEIILVNDGSKDSSKDICQKYMDRDSRIKVINQANAGVSAARNNGLNHATGKYIQFVDSDDKIAANMCEKLVERQKDTNADVVICGYVLVKNNIEKEICATDTLFTEVRSFSKEFPEYLSRFLIHSPCNKLYLRDRIAGRFDKAYSLGEDLVFNIQFLDTCQKIVGLADALYYYIITESDNKKERADSAESLYYVLKNFIDNRFDKDESSLKAARLVYVNDRLYNIHLLSLEENGIQKIKDFCENAVFKEIAWKSKKDSVKCYMTYLGLKYHLYIIFYLYFKIKGKK